MPFKSSGDVSVRHSTTLLPLRVSISAVAAVNAIRPVAAPGPAGKPRAMAVAAFSALGSKTGTRRESIDSAGILSKAAFWFIRRSRCISTAILTAARPVRLPLRVCRMNKRPFSIVNSKSCMSLKWRSNLVLTCSRFRKLFGIEIAMCEIGCGVLTPATTSSP